MTTVPSLRQERRALAAELREQHKTWVEVAGVFADLYGVNMRTAFRLAHGWSQGQAADAWNERWPADPKTFKNISYWEQWPASTGYAPSLDVLARLAELYQCSVAHLLTDCPDFRSADMAQRARSRLATLGAELSGDTAVVATDADLRNPNPSGIERLVNELEGMGVEELASTVRSWMAHADPAMARRDLLLRLSAALSLAASGAPVALGDNGHAPDLEPAHDLSGIWLSRYTYHSSGRAEEFHGEHHVSVRQHGDRLVCRSLSKPEESKLRLNLSVAGAIATGTWTERTSLSGYYQGATYHGTLQLIVSPMGRAMGGRWLGFNKQFKVNTGEWQLTWIEGSTNSRAFRHHL